MGDVAGLTGLEAVVRRGLAASAGAQPLEWVADQIGMAHLALAKARLTSTQPRAVGMILAEAMETAREWGAPALVQRAALLQAKSKVPGSRD